METPQGWDQKDGKLVREYAFADFEAAVRFINAVAGIAQHLNHHPEIWNSYNKVRLTLSTHEAGDTVTEKDHSLALEINTI
jgi:4a-hydroxytetrahydrobiopterin dehydratase